MFPLAERWAGGNWRWRLACWLVFTLLCAVVTGWLWRQPGAVHQQQVADAQQSHQQYRALQRRVLALALAEIDAGPVPREPLPVLAFAAAAGGDFVAWHPEKPAGAELVFTLAWDKVPPLFPRLMSYAVQLHGFSLAPHPGGLLLTLHLGLQPE